MIRQEKTKSTKESRSFWERSVWGNNGKDTSETETIINSVNKIYQSGDKAKIKELELQSRIAAVTEHDTYQTRLDDAKKKGQVAKIVEEKLLKNYDKDKETEEQFTETLNGFGDYYNRIKKQAIKEVYGNE